ncbi:hypothetical protein PpBr36_02120 [Pyricularia pennisetigena]|uniref:hypothetical protein n=1 Tax=Pyricularia pennisetigena TaxID=1578925 RepID=UPI0011536D33|nr:hypothetical protein PpBr36_02120 [Pyricularia pennisetigena]TLS28392.1 hypothetical protein PpBr36_02120 [Pyricularia pennisetigena]
MGVLKAHTYISQGLSEGLASAGWHCNLVSQQRLTFTSASLVEDEYINGQATVHNVAELEDCSIAIDATYYLQYLLHTPPTREPLLTALGGMNGLDNHIREDLANWKAHNVTPFFIFDGQSMMGQDEVITSRGRKSIEKSTQAWELYVNGQAQEAVNSFGNHNGAFIIQNLYRMLQKILKDLDLHFLVAPYNAAAQIAYLDMIDSDQCAGIMGPQELLLYPIKDMIIRSIDWTNKTATAISKRNIIKQLGIGDNTFADALLMVGTSFLPPFPPLQDGSVLPVPRRQNVVDAINMLRASEKSVASACHSFSDILKSHDPNWLDKYSKAKMAVAHFIYIAEDGAVTVYDYDKLTKDNHEYLGLQLPAELFHYLNTGLIGPRMLSWITHSKITVLPTIDGNVSEEYRNLVTKSLVPVKEMTLSLLIPRLNRGIGFRDVAMKVWFDDKFTYNVNHRNVQPSPGIRTASWLITDSKLKSLFPKPESGSIAFEVLSLKNPDLVSATSTKDRIKGASLDSADVIVSVTIWRFLHLRGYVSDSHELTPWGQTLAHALQAIEPVAKEHPDFEGLYEQLLVAFEMIRFGVLHTKAPQDESHGLPLNGSEDDKGSLLLLSRVATLLKLRHAPTGYTGPLNKSLLVFRSLASTVREADRDLVEAIVASMFMYAQAKRERDDSWEIGNRLPFTQNPDIAFGIAVKTLLDEVQVGEPPEVRRQRMETFPAEYVPHSTDFEEDMGIFYAFFEAIAGALKTLPDKELSAAAKGTWETATKYLELRK